MEHRRRHRRTGDRRGGAELTAEPTAAKRSAGAYTRLIRPVLFRRHGGDAERVHEETLRQLAAVGATTVGRAALRAVAGRHRTPTTVAGIDFPGLVGVAAGLDKNGVAARSWAALGFGFAELGTVTAQPQPGNEAPRLFRLPASEAIINRMGFNNAGAQALADRLRALGVRRGNGALGMPVGISIGKTKIIALDQAVPDYLASLHAVADVADYVAVNVSSPNTPGLRRLQDRAALHALLSALVGAAGSLPIMVKIAPDLDRAAVDEAVDVCTETGVAGLIATNTTLGRDGLRFADLGKAAEVGGLSGAPLTARAREVVGWLTASTGLPVIGVGGIGNLDDAQALLDAGAGLVQLYTGFIYQGPGLVRSLNRGLRPSGSVPPPTSRSLPR